jgi:hypothetical protein
MGFRSVLCSLRQTGSGANAPKSRQVAPATRGQRSSANLRRQPQPCPLLWKPQAGQPLGKGAAQPKLRISDRSAAALQAYNLGGYKLGADNLAQADIRRAACCSRTAQPCR